MPEPANRVSRRRPGRWQFSLLSLLIVMTGVSLALGAATLHPEFGPVAGISLLCGSTAAAAVMSRHRRLAYYLTLVAMGGLFYCLLRLPISPCSSALFHTCDALCQRTSTWFLLPFLMTVISIGVVATTLRRWIRRAEKQSLIVQSLVMTFVSGAIFLPALMLVFSDNPFAQVLREPDWVFIIKALMLLVTMTFAILMGGTGAMLSGHVMVPLWALTIALLRRIEPVGTELTEDDWRMLAAIASLRAEGKSQAAGIAERLGIDFGELQRRLDRLARLGVVEVDLDGFRCLVAPRKRLALVPLSEVSDMFADAATAELEGHAP